MNTTTPIGAKAPPCPPSAPPLGPRPAMAAVAAVRRRQPVVHCLAGLPVWNWLAGVLNHSVHVDAIAAGRAPALLLDAVLSRDAPTGVIGESSLIAAILMLLLSPAGWRGGGCRGVCAAGFGFGDLLRGAIPPNTGRCAHAHLVDRPAWPSPRW